MIHFILTENFQTKVIAKKNIKTSKTIMNTIESLADGKFGKNQWERVVDKNPSLSNIIGYYIVEFADERRTIEAEYQL